MKIPQSRVKPGQDCPRRARADHEGAQAWRVGLPESWLGQVVTPIFYTRHYEYEMAASRVVGYETAMQPCYCRYDVEITEPRSDDDELWYPGVVYAEQLCGWRLRDERWLIRRQLWHGEECAAPQVFFTLSEEMPR
ncbi:MAG: hypothetical protein REI09_12360 [Candidatus Dactylopiibacterium sp.]|nr:hypothetical protein [Candidatus Dactylopiibacterium sp.]